MSDIISARTVSATLTKLEDNGLITNRPTKGGDSYFVTKTSKDRTPATSSDENFIKPGKNQGKDEFKLDFAVQHNSDINFTPYEEILALRNQVEELVKSAKNKDLNEMREKIEILEKEKRKISDENITLKRELIKLQDLWQVIAEFQGKNHQFKTS